MDAAPQPPKANLWILIKPMCMLCSLCSASRRGVFFLLLLPLWLSASPLVEAQWSNNRGYQLLQRVDDVLFSVDNLSLVILDRRYVAGTLVRVNVHQPNPVRGSAQFVADCQKPLRLALRPAHASGRAVPAELEFAPVKMLDGSWAAAEFACESTRQPERASRLAKEIFERGGP